MAFFNLQSLSQTSKNNVSPLRKRKREDLKGKMDASEGGIEDQVVTVKDVDCMFKALVSCMQGTVYHEDIEIKCQIMMDGLYEAIETDMLIDDVNEAVINNVKKLF